MLTGVGAAGGPPPPRHRGVAAPLPAEQWWISYTDNHVSATQQILREQLDLAKSIGMKIEHFPFPFDKKERVDVYHIYAVKRVGFE